jgi:uncharacterized membrane protein
MGYLAQAGPAVTAAFLASLVEAVEAMTIILAVAMVRGWRPAGLGAVAGVTLLVLVAVTFGPLLTLIPLRPLQLATGTLLFLFGMRWLQKAVLRSAGRIPLHDEAMTFESETSVLRGQAQRQQSRLDWLGGLTSFKAVLLEGMEVIFIVLAFSAGPNLVVPASIGAAAACLIIVVAGLAMHRPLARVPENSLKFGVGILLTSFGIFWVGEGLGVMWPGGDLAVIAFALLVLVAARLAVGFVRRSVGRL